MNDRAIPTDRDIHRSSSGVILNKESTSCSFDKPPSPINHLSIVAAHAPGIPADYEYTPMTYAASLLKEHVNIPVIAAWGIETLNRGDRLIRKGNADLAAYAKPFLADPEFVLKSKNNMDYKPCFGCRNCQWYSNGNKCPGRKRAQKTA